ncbi:hypothetical protein KPH14_012635 [Odynerus spinipes]|uniref:DUF7041 domain-containing protein n=1 Tax=Odynerus spinipes TaxID=1348599 RepID=A0AAD9VL72_9HYME|nr:hypothetical protein KPH14_012635 [Odynerus spinipes]
MPIEHSPPGTSPAPAGTDQNMASNNEPGEATTPTVRGDIDAAATHAVRLPPFWRESPHLWFTQVEAAFGINRIVSDDTKFRYVVLHLDTSVLPLVADIITAPPEKDKYLTLKERLVGALGETSASRLRKLLTSHELGTDKPSILLQKLRNLAHGQVTDEVLRTIFMEQLPENVRAVLAISEVTDLNKLAHQADKVLELSRPAAPLLQAVDVESDTIGKLTAQITALTQQIAGMYKPYKNRGRSRNRTQDNRARSRGRSQSKDRNNNICYYHHRFGKLARKCTKPWADISVIPKRMVHGAVKATDFQLFAANNTVIHTYGTQTRTLNLGLRRPFLWNFVIADVKQPIIGADFLAHHGILPDLKNRRLIDEQTTLTTKARYTTIAQVSITVINTDCKIPVAEEDKHKTAITTPFGKTRTLNQRGKVKLRRKRSRISRLPGQQKGNQTSRRTSSGYSRLQNA